MAWGNTDGPEMGPEWHGSDRGTNSNWGCLAASLCLVALVALVVWTLW
jgi:hypothetical protein